MFDVKCRVEVILGNASLSVRNCLRLERQSIVRLQQAAGSDLEVRVQGVTVATGEVVILDDNTALRISRVSPPAGVEAA
jgi:flagellar motor switch protein FliN/FliY